MDEAGHITAYDGSTGSYEPVRIETSKVKNPRLGRAVAPALMSR